MALADKTAQAVYSWILEDVLPVIPNFFPASYCEGYKATPQADGSFRLDRLPKGYHLKPAAVAQPGAETEKGALVSEWDYIPPDLIHPHSNQRKTTYEILVDGYKGTLPVYPQATPAQPNPPQPL
jgi:hypothetical protein